jgi:integrase/recombinase XerD
MKVQRIKYPNGQFSWIVIDNNFLPIQPIEQFLKYCESLERSPHTIEAYARHLKLYWEFISSNQINWKEIQLNQLAEFIPWLRRHNPNVLSIEEQDSRRSERTINTIISAVYSFYDYHFRRGEVKDLNLYRESPFKGKAFKPFLHHISKSKPTQTKLIKLKEPKRAIKTFSKEEVKVLINACINIRDKLLLSLLHETGMRIGQALGLRHEDFIPWDNQIKIVPRNNINNARAKTHSAYSIDVSIELMSLYSDYFAYEYPEDLVTDYVFVNLYGKRKGYPMNYANISDLFKRLRKKTGIQEAHPHMFRHTHATDLVEAGVDASFIKDRLGHASIQTTINTYTHIRPKALKKAYQDYLNRRED